MKTSMVFWMGIAMIVMMCFGMVFVIWVWNNSSDGCWDR